MKRLMLVLALAPFCAAADDEFTPEQMATIQRMLDAHGAKIRQEILAEVAAKQNGGGTAGKDEIEEPDTPVLLPGSADEIRAMERRMTIEEASRIDTPTRSQAVPLDRGFSVDDPASARVYKFQVEFDEDGGRASAGVSKVSEVIATGNSPRYHRRAWDMILSRPISESDKGSVNFATLDGLSTSLRLDYSYKWQHSSVRKLIEAVDGRSFDGLCSAHVDGGDRSCSLSALRQSLGEESETYRAFMKRNYPWIFEHALGLHIGQDTYDYITPQLGAGSERHTGRGASFSTSFISPTRDWLFSVGGKYQQVYRSNDEVVLCPPDNGVDPVQCQSGSLGPPTRKTTRVLWGEVRGSFKDFGYSLRASHDLASGETGVDLPIYFIRNNDGDLSGGLRLGWTDKQDFGVGIFLSKPFKLK
jgi:hypothetical protein